MAQEIWDISPAIAPGIPVWPGDTEYEENRTWAISEQCPVNVSRFSMSTHTGSHVDAPLHYSSTGKTAGQMDLTPYIGPCFVMDVTNKQSPVLLLEDIQTYLTQEKTHMPRILFKTYKHAPQTYWDENFTAIDPSIIFALAKCGCQLIGTDTPSLDPQNSKTLAAHQAVKSQNMSILEGVILDEVKQGWYELIALPLKLQNLDAAPVRAILRSLPSNI